jgi:hypothetical protein
MRSLIPVLSEHGVPRKPKKIQEIKRKEIASIFCKQALMMMPTDI